MRSIKVAVCGLFAGLCILAGPEPVEAVTFKPYGFIKADLAADYGSPNSGGGYGTNYVRWLLPAPEERPLTWAMHARQSRIGFDFLTDAADDIKVLGRIETDFTNPSAEFVYALKLRKAYLQVSTPELEFIAGQTSDMFNPLVPDTVNYLVAWWAGNIGFRRPQFRLTYKLKLSETSGIDLTGGIMRSIPSQAELDNVDVPFPAAAARIGYRSKPLSIGVSGHYGQEKETFEITGEEDFDSYSANLDLTVAFTDTVSFKGEAWYGQNLDAYLGGIAQGVAGPVLDDTGAVVKDPVGIVSMGGWAQIGYKSDTVKVNLGGSVDMPDEDDLPVGGRSLNMSSFLNVYYRFLENTWVAVEGSYWRTHYKEPPEVEDKDADLIRGQMAFIYTF